GAAECGGGPWKGGIRRGGLARSPASPVGRGFGHDYSHGAAQGAGAAVCVRARVLRRYSSAFRRSASDRAQGHLGVSQRQVRAAEQGRGNGGDAGAGVIAGGNSHHAMASPSSGAGSVKQASAAICSADGQSLSGMGERERRTAAGAVGGASTQTWRRG